MDNRPQFQVASVAGAIGLCAPIVLGAQSPAVLFTSGPSLQGYSLADGKAKGSLTDHDDFVSGLALSSSFIFSASVHGQLIISQQDTLQAVAQVQLNIPLLKLVCTSLPATDLAIENASTIKVKECVLVLTAKVLEANKKLVYEAVYCWLDDLLKNKVELKPLLSHIGPRLETLTFDEFTIADALPNHQNRSLHAIISANRKRLIFHMIFHLSASNDNDSSSTCYYDLADNITTIAVSQHKGVVAVGHEDGKISILSNIFDFLRSFAKSKVVKPTTINIAIHHWHAHSVLALAFSGDGRLLFSGGEENVLVVWDLVKSSKSFLPRLGAPVIKLVGFSQPERMNQVLVCTVDHTLRLVNTANMDINWAWQTVHIASTNKLQQQHSFSKDTQQSDEVRLRSNVLRALQGFRLQDDHAEKGWFPTLNINPNSSMLVTNGSPGVLQEVDVQSLGIVKKCHRILNFTRISRKDAGSKIYTPSITRFAFSENILVTIDVRRGEEMPKEYSLKFWERRDPTAATATAVTKGGEQEDEFVITAQIAAPHGDSPITSLAISSALLVATGCSNGIVKVWRQKTVSHMPSENDSESHSNNKHHFRMKWTCLYSFQYRIAPCLAMTFSLDNSLLAVAHEQLVTFWDPYTITQRGLLSLHHARKITHLTLLEPRGLPQYGNGGGDAFVIIGTGGTVSCYSLLSMEEIWEIQSNVVQTIAVASSENECLFYSDCSMIKEEGWIAVAVSTDNNETVVKVFCPLSSEPVLVVSIQRRIVITSIGFLPSNQGLAVVTSDGDMLLLQSQVMSLKRKQTAVGKAMVREDHSLPVISIHSDGTENQAGVVHQKKKKQKKEQEVVTSAATVSVTLANKDWLRSFLPENTADLPRTMDIAEDYMQTIMTSSITAAAAGHELAAEDDSISEGNEAKRKSKVFDVTSKEVSKMRKDTSVLSEDTIELSLKQLEESMSSALGKRKVVSSSAAAVADDDVSVASSHTSSGGVRSSKRMRKSVTK